MDKSGLEYDISNRSKDPNDISWIPMHEDNDDDSSDKIEKMKLELINLQKIGNNKL
jgi:hypothetical protein